MSDNKTHSTITKTQAVCRQNTLKWSIHLTLNSNIINCSIRLCGLSLNLIPTVSLLSTEKTQNTGGGQAWPEDEFRGDSEQLWWVHKHATHLNFTDGDWCFHILIKSLCGFSNYFSWMDPSKAWISSLCLLSSSCWLSFFCWIILTLCSISCLFSFSPSSSRSES